MKVNCAFTICATNYIGLAQVLERSIFEHYDELDFYIVVADEPKPVVKEGFEDNVLVAKDILSYNYTERKWYEMAFKYDLTEFCTSIKPASIKYFFNQGYEKCIYFDPDIYAFSSIKSIYDVLDNHSVVLTPHITQMEIDSTCNIKEQQLLKSGIFNLGFIGVRNNEKTFLFLDWWSKRLEDYSFHSIPENLFTDQRWMDLIPGFFGNDLFISLDKGMNMAPWNFHERQIRGDKGELMVENRIKHLDILNPLIFVHFSGYKYSNLINGDIQQKNIKSMKEYVDLDILFKSYQDALKNSSFTSYADYDYSYSFYENGTPIHPMARRLYRSIVENKGCEENPFICDSSVYRKTKHMGKSMVIMKDNSNNEFKREMIIKIMNSILILIYKIIGTRLYFKALNVFKYYGTIENHSFLLK